ncbi:kinesin [Pochonia chlamydosporia 170]|uniref:Kinesin n=1 Tax=Pochonia chlamydosporia 170 TaxID=1380566 RepID=A0A179G4D3_METCM|nr:kinesin [Pochonia chlamydosporia 170]OAQ72193.2 kinesin [Pochonia chlamydosporia 170]
MNTITFGDGNSGFQAGTIHGLVSTEFHYYPASEQPETPPNPSILIPFGRDGDFVKREELIDQIEHSCGRPGSRTALVGLGGVGKSQLAIEYAYCIRERSSDTWAFWIHASNSARFEQSFRDIATRVKLPGRQNPKANIFQLVHDWLQDEKKGPWVIVLDNVDDPSFLKLPGPNIEAAAKTIETSNQRPLISYIPYCQHGSVLVTSRSRGAALELVEHANIIAIEPMNEKDALQLFQNKLGQSDNEACTIELAAALEYMPLAIIQAAAYVLQMRPRYSLQKYLDEFRKSDRRKADLLGRKGGGLRRDAEAKNSILITWQISFDYIRETRPSAADLLSLMSFCDRQGIPEFLLRRRNDCTRGDGEQSHRGGTNDMGDGDEHNNDADDNESIDSSSDSDSDSTAQQSNYSNNDRFENDILTLRNFSFITANEDRTTFEMHRLVQLATLEWLRAHDVYEKGKHQFLVRLCAEIPVGEYENWTKCQTLFPHAQSVSAQRPASKESTKEWATILYKAAWYAFRKGKGIEAEDLSVRAMKARKKIFDKEHEDVVWSKAMVASAYGLRGRWSDAEELEVQVMETRKKKLGEDHPDTLTSMGNLASTLWNQGRWEAAEKLLVQVIETRKKKLGENHPDTLTSMANLAVTFWNQGRWEAAEKLLVQVIETRKKKLGENHPDTLTSMANLAVTFWNQGRWEAAEKLLVQVIETRKKKLGEDHPDTLNSMASLASTYRNQGRWEAAEKLLVQVIETRKKKLGKDHPDTLNSMNNLALTYWDLGRLEEAKTLMRHCVPLLQAKLGANHPNYSSAAETPAGWET